MPIDNKLDTFQKNIKKISNEKNVQKLLKQP